MRQTAARLTAALLPWGLLAPLPATATSGTPADSFPALRACALPGVDGEARCGTFEVREDRALAAGRRLSLRLVVLPATGADPVADPVVVLTGGPGQAASEGAAREAHELAALRERRAVVLLDQRGTGGSNPLQCTPPFATPLARFLGPPPPPSAIAACREELAARGDLRRYASLDAVADLEELRAAFGWPQVNLVAGSYGTRVALLYMRSFPQRVRVAVLQGVSPPGSANPLPFSRAGQRALDALIAACAADASCRQAFPRFGEQLREVVERLGTKPAVVSLPDPAGGAAARIELTRSLFVSRLHLMLLAGPLAAHLPSLVDSAHRGDYLPFAELALAFGRAISEQIYFGMQLSVSCTEDAPFLVPAAVARETSATLLGSLRVEQLLGYCGEWPRGELPADFTTPVRADVPTLLIAGEVDPVTPTEMARAVAAELPRSRLVVLPGASHVDGGECVRGMVAAFVAGADPRALDDGCLSGLRRPTFVLPAPGGGDASPTTRPP
jgi:pimeloyl-ACP methyl ester carboxylesterase